MIDLEVLKRRVLAGLLILALPFVWLGVIAWTNRDSLKEQFLQLLQTLKDGS